MDVEEEHVVWFAGNELPHWMEETAAPICTLKAVLQKRAQTRGHGMVAAHRKQGRKEPTEVSTQEAGAGELL